MIDRESQTPSLLHDLTKLFLRTDGPASAGARLARGALATLICKVAYSGLSFLVSVLLARWLGAAGYGAYAYAMAWVVLLTVPATLGMDNLLMREVAAYHVRSAWGEMRSLLRQANLAVLLVSFGLAAAAAAFSWLFASRANSQVISTFWAALLLLPLISLTRLSQAALQGLDRVAQAQVPALVVHPLLLAVLLLGAHVLVAGPLTPSLGMKLNALAAGIALLGVVWLLRRGLPEAVKRAAPVQMKLAWVRSVLPLVFLASMGVVYAQADTLMLGTIKGAKAVGIYGIADGAAQLVAFFLMAVSPALAPTISRLYAAHDREQLQRLITKSARWTLMASFPVALGLIAFGDWFLLRFFGPDFVQGQTALTILTIGQLFNVGMGSVGYLLIMTGHERDAAKGIAVSAAVNIALNAAFIPRWGLEGAATAAATSMILWNVWLSLVVYKRLGIHSTALGRLGARP